MRAPSADTIVANLRDELQDRQALLEMETPAKRLERLHELMQAEIEILQVEREDPFPRQEADGEDAEGVLPGTSRWNDPEGAMAGDRDEFKNEIQEIEEQLEARSA